MPVSRLANAFLGMGVAALALPLGGYSELHAQLRAQARAVVSKEVSVGRSESALRLELDGGETLAISFENGSVLVNDEPVGSFVAGSELDAAWRELLSQAVALDDGPLASALVDWTAPAALTGDAGTVARAIDQALEGALTNVNVQTVSLGDSISFSMGDSVAF